MGDPGLREAIRAAGGVTELARRIGISQPSVSNWLRVPAERVLSVEAATGVGRAMLRPDLYEGRPPLDDVDAARAPPPPLLRGAPPPLDDVDAARARQYALLAVLLAQAPSDELLTRLARPRGDATPLGAALAALADAARGAATETIEREFFDLFVGVGRGEL